MRMATCICGEHGSVNVSGEGFGRTFTRGAIFDLDEPVTPDAKLTWGDAIGKSYAHLFEDAPAEPSAAPRRREHPPDVAKAVASRGTRASDPATEQ